MADAFLTRKGGEDVTPEVNEQTVIIQDIMEALVGKVYGANATAETILKGYSAYVHQNLVEGTMEAGIPTSLFGCTKFAIDEFSFTADTSVIPTTIKHSLGETPTAFMIIPKTPINGTQNIYVVGVPNGIFMNNGYVHRYPVVKDRASASYSVNTNYNMQPIFTSTELQIKGGTNALTWHAGTTYTLITMA